MSTMTMVLRARKTGTTRHAALVAHPHRGPTDVLGDDPDLHGVSVPHRREELHLHLDGGGRETRSEHLGVGPSHVAREEVLEGLVQEVDQVRVVGDPGRVEVAEPDEDAGLEQRD